MTGARRELLNIDDRLAVLEAHVGDFLAVGRPDGGDDRFMGLKGGLAVAAVAVADDELIAVAGELGHVDELRRKDRAFAREIRVDAVGDAVRAHAHVVARRREDGRVRQRTRHGVVQIVGELPAAVGKTADAAHGERVRAELAEGLEARGLFKVLGFAFGARRDQAERAGSLKVGSDDGRSIEPRGAGAFKHLDGDRELIGAHARDGDLKFGKRRTCREGACKHASAQHSAAGRIEVGHG